MEQLVEKAINGDAEAFTSLIQSINKDLYSIARTRLDNLEDIDEALQETMIIAYKSIKKLNNPSLFKFWIIKILINECNKIYNNNKKKQSLFEKIVGKNKEEYTNVDDIQITNIENKMDIEQILEILNYDEKICITLFYKYHYSVEEISKILQCNSNTIRSRISRAKQKIKNNYKEGGLKYGI